MGVSCVRFMLDGQLIELDDVDPARTVLQFLREDLGRTGTKEGCAEGDCGACTVVVAELCGDDLSLKAINSCIQFLPTLDGKELITVESLSPPGAELHPVQRAMAENHGSQCGFCTPGFVMSLFALYKTNALPGRQEIDDALAGNLCRCTGYRPIVAAAHSMYEKSAADDRSDWLRQACGRQQKPARRIESLRKLAREADLELEHGDRRYFAPTGIDSLAERFARHPDATLLAGGTDIGLWVTKQHRELGTVIYTGRVAKLLAVSRSPTHLDIGAAVTLSEAIPQIVEHYPGLEEIFRRFASPPIRNTGTLGGNIANGSPIGDSMAALMVVGATLLLRRGDDVRELPLDAFYHDYRVNDLAPGEFIERIRIPLVDGRAVVRSQKWSKRFDQDISAVCTAYFLELDGGKVAAFRMACGGLAPIIKRATHCEGILVGEAWSEPLIERACVALQSDFTPISDARATADIRLLAVQNLLRRFYRETAGAAESTVYLYGRSG